MLTLRNKSVLTKPLKALLLVVALAAVFAIQIHPTVLADTVNVIGGSNGSSCNSGGYFHPSSITLNDGDTITFSVPSDDPYSGGVQVNGFPEGSFVVARGGTHVTQPIHANVSFQGTWPNALSCLKGSGTVSVIVPPPAPVITPTPTPTASPPSSATQSTPAASPTTTTSPKSTPTITPPTTPTTTPAPTTASTTLISTPATIPKVATVQQPAKKNTSSVLPVAASGGIIILAIAGFFAYRLLLQRRKSNIQPPNNSLPPTPPPIIGTM